ncbi:MAG: haloacid dehalogenase-like hydrolase [Erysipelotrichaceae bacterium]|nr:haloacid dehalogenase-like hydrolase [Erysipelotrichaceae bacterium]
MKKIAIMYDFDKTLCNRDMQEYSLIPELGYEDPNKFWAEVGKITKANKMDSILAYMYMLLKKSESVDRPIRKADFMRLGKDIEFYPGVLTWFERINKIGEALDLEIEHYIISSGMSEIIEGSAVYPFFKKVYACRYYYDANGVAKWPALVVNYTTKTQYIFRINKQVLDENEDSALNTYTPEALRPIPFKRMIYIADGLTDVPCMKLVKEYGGKSIAVYNPDKGNSISRMLIEQGRANFECPSNYEQGGPMEDLLHKILVHMKADSDLEEMEG